MARHTSANCVALQRSAPARQSPADLCVVLHTQRLCQRTVLGAAAVTALWQGRTARAAAGEPIRLRAPPYLRDHHRELSHMLAIEIAQLSDNGVVVLSGHTARVPIRWRLLAIPSDRPFPVPIWAWRPRYAFCATHTHPHANSQAQHAHWSAPARHTDHVLLTPMREWGSRDLASRVFMEVKEHRRVGMVPELLCARPIWVVPVISADGRAKGMCAARVHVQLVLVFAHRHEQWHVWRTRVCGKAACSRHPHQSERERERAGERAGETRLICNVRLKVQRLVRRVIEKRSAWRGRVSE